MAPGFKIVTLLTILSAVVSATNTRAEVNGVKMPPEIGAAYGRLGKAISTRDIEGVKSVWADTFVVNAPNNQILYREEVIAAMNDDLLDYKSFKKVVGHVSQEGDVVIVMGHDELVPTKGPGAGRALWRPFTDIWLKGARGWRLIARQATIAAETP